MTARVLDRSEWELLDGTTLGPVTTHLPNTALVLVVEDDDGAVVGCTALIACWHCHGLWIAPAHRGRVAVARWLWHGVRAVAEALGIREVLAGARTPEVERLLQHVGARQVPGGTYAVPLTAPRGWVERQERVM